MHRTLAITLLITAFVGRLSTQAPAFEVLHTGQAERLITSCFIHGAHGYVAGGEGPTGVLLRTANSGRSWGRVEVADARQLHGVSLPAGGYQWACGVSGGLSRSINGGRDWERVNARIAEYSDAAWAAIHFVDRARGFLAGSADQAMALARTTNRGKGWVSLRDRVPAEARGSGLRALAFPSPEVGFACGENGVLIRTEDGGDHWSLGATGTSAHLQCMSFLDPQVGFVAGDQGTLLRTEDSGATWTPLALPTSDEFRGVAFTAANHGYVALAREGVMWTDDGGTSWRRLPIDGEFVSLVAGPDGTVWVTCANGRVVRIVPGAGTVRGMVRDARGDPIADAVVFPCFADSGNPLAIDGRHSLTEMLANGNNNLSLAHAVSNDKGRFQLILPAGTWRLVAQSWPEQNEATQPLRDYTHAIDLHGVADKIEIDSGGVTDTALSPLGDAALEIDVDIGNNWTVLGLSSGAPHTASILGFAAWGGGFGRGLLGGVRMNQGKTLVRGLPAGTVHVALFQNDNNPSFGTATFELEAGRVRRERLDLDSSGLPDSLLALDAELKGVDLRELLSDTEALRGYLEAPAKNSGGLWSRYAAVIGHGDRKIELPNGGEARCADLLAVLQYRMEKR